MIGWPRLSPIAACRTRVLISTFPPGAYGITSMTGLVGYCCAFVGMLSADKTIDASTNAELNQRPTIASPRKGNRQSKLVPRTRSSHTGVARAVANFGFKRGTRIIELLVSLDSEVRIRGCRKGVRTSESGH